MSCRGILLAGLAALTLGAWVPVAAAKISVSGCGKKAKKSNKHHKAKGNGKARKK